MTDVNNLSSMGGFINKKIKPLKDEISIIKTELKNIKKQLILSGVSNCDAIFEQDAKLTQEEIEEDCRNIPK